MSELQIQTLFDNGGHEISYGYDDIGGRWVDAESALAIEQERDALKAEAVEKDLEISNTKRLHSEALFLLAEKDRRIVELDGRLEMVRKWYINYEDPLWACMGDFSAELGDILTEGTKP